MEITRHHLYLGLLISNFLRPVQSIFLVQKFSAEKMETERDRVTMCKGHTASRGGVDHTPTLTPPLASDISLMPGGGSGGGGREGSETRKGSLIWAFSNKIERTHKDHEHSAYQKTIGYGI